MTTDEEYFENNLMPKLLAAYQETRAKGETQYCFDEKKVLEYRSEGGFPTRAWEDENLENNLNYLINKGLIIKVGAEEYCLAEHGKRWQQERTSE
jgi:hypothetical protein